MLCVAVGREAPEIYAKRNERRRARKADPSIAKAPHEHPFYTIWTWMRHSCYDPKHKGYAALGALGITVCDRWLEPDAQGFLNWLADMGDRRTKYHKLTRLDERANFTPENTVWESSSERLERVVEQACNKCGEVKPLVDFAIDSRAVLGVAGDCKDCKNKANAVQKRAKGPFAKHNMTLEQYEAMLESQGGGCAFNPSHPPRDTGYYCVDHDHACCPGDTSCGKCIRGLLCSKCNSMLGLGDDDPATLRAGADYLERYAQRTEAGDYYDDPPYSAEPTEATGNRDT